MSVTRTYCRAYPLGQMRQFPDWPRHRADASVPAADSGDQDIPDAECVFLHESYVVTQGVHRDEQVLFDAVTPAWIDYCQRTLGFAVPSLLAGESAGVEGQG